MKAYGPENGAPKWNPKLANRTPLTNTCFCATSIRSRRGFESVYRLASPNRRRAKADFGAPWSRSLYGCRPLPSRRSLRRRGRPHSYANGKLEREAMSDEAEHVPGTGKWREPGISRSSVATVICYGRGCARMGRSGEVPFFFIRHARANVVNDNIPPHTSPRSLGVFADRSCQRLGNPCARARYIEDQRSSFGRPWLRSDGEREMAAINPRSRPNAPGISRKILIAIGVSSPKEATSPKGRGYPLRQNQILPRFRGRDMK
jgi:hypothetical protein